MSNCACGLTRAELDAHGWVDGSGRCKAPFELPNGEERIGCGKLYASHPTSLGKNNLCNLNKKSNLLIFIYVYFDRLDISNHRVGITPRIGFVFVGYGISFKLNLLTAGNMYIFLTFAFHFQNLIRLFLFNFYFKSIFLKI